MLKLTLSLVALLSCALAGAVEFKLGKFSGDEAKMRAFLSLTQSRLSDSIHRQYPGQVIVDFGHNIGPSVLAAPHCADPLTHSTGPVIYGYVNPLANNFRFHKRISLHQGFLKVIEEGDQKREDFACGHKNYYKLAQATLLHELMHLVDAASENELSSNKLYLKLTGWTTTSRTKIKNLPRSADSYEYAKNSQEHFAVNAEYFFLDPEFSCRNPALYNYFSKAFQHVPFLDQKCSFNYEVRLSETSIVKNLEPSKIYSIDYLMAHNGKEAMSRFGHSMMRLVMCAPHRQTMSEECRKDVSHHLVVSFRANIDDGMTSPWKGLTGKYPAMLFILPMSEVIEEYTKVELRSLISVPLKLSADDKTSLIQNIISKYWTYVGKYYFITNNCATEVRDLIQTSVPNSFLLTQNPKTPKAVLASLIEAQLVTPVRAIIEKLSLDKLDDESKKTLVKTGLYFPSNKENMQIAMQKINQAYGTKWTLDEYLNKTKTIERGFLFDDHLEQRPKDVLASLYLLEKTKLRTEVTNLRVLIFNRLILNEKNAQIKDSFEANLIAQQKTKSTLSYLINPKQGYGVPFKEEVRSEVSSATPRATVTSKEEITAVEKWINERFFYEQNEANKTAEYLKRSQIALVAALKAQHP
jgi:hypothetical protein